MPSSASIPLAPCNNSLLSMCSELYFFFVQDLSSLSRASSPSREKPSNTTMFFVPCHSSGTVGLGLQESYISAMQGIRRVPLRSGRPLPREVHHQT